MAKRSRKLNKLEVQHGAGYEYVIKYEIFKLLNLDKRPCKNEISWKEDDCKMEKRATVTVSKFYLLADFLLEAMITRTYFA